MTSMSEQDVVLLLKQFETQHKQDLQDLTQRTLSSACNSISAAFVPLAELQDQFREQTDQRLGITNHSTILEKEETNQSVGQISQKRVDADDTANNISQTRNHG